MVVACATFDVEVAVISTFSPVGSLSSNGMRMRVFVCIR